MLRDGISEHAADMVAHRPEGPKAVTQDSSRGHVGTAGLYAHVDAALGRMRDRVSAKLSASAEETTAIKTGSEIHSSRLQTHPNTCESTPHGTMLPTYSRMRVWRSALARVWSSPSITKVAHEPSSDAFCNSTPTTPLCRHNEPNDTQPPPGHVPQRPCFVRPQT